MTSTSSGNQMTSPTTQSFLSLVEENHSLRPEDFYLCVAGVALSYWIIRGMMLLSGTWEDQYENSQGEIPALEAVKNQIVDGSDSWFQMTGTKLEIKSGKHLTQYIDRVRGLSL